MRKLLLGLLPVPLKPLDRCDEVSFTDLIEQLCQYLLIEGDRRAESTAASVLGQEWNEMRGDGLVSCLTIRFSNVQSEDKTF